MTKLWLLRGDRRGYDTYDSCIVAADTEEQARMISPAEWKPFGYSSAWASTPEAVKIEYLGLTDRKISGIILASFNAG